jgi:RNA polymerase primary sigma factor
MQNPGRRASDLSPGREAVEEAELLRLARGGDARARERLVAAKLGLVRAVAARYRDLGVPLDDLVQEGSIGLLEAIDRYDAGRGMSFDRYVRFRVRRAVRNALTEQARLIRLPKQVVERRRAIERAAARLTAAAGRAPTADEIAGETGLSPVAVVEARLAGLTPVSLDARVVAGDSTLGASVVDPAAVDPELQALEDERAERLDAAIARLPERQRLIVRRRWGVGAEAASTGAVARVLELSPRRTQAIGRDALDGLRAALRDGDSAAIASSASAAARGR